jgi:hypothetical protein
MLGIKVNACIFDKNAGNAPMAPVVSHRHVHRTVCCERDFGRDLRFRIISSLSNEQDKPASAANPRNPASDRRRVFNVMVVPAAAF